MLDAMVFAAAVWVCPGNVFSDEPREGCKPFHETHGSFSTIPEAPGLSAPEPPPSAPAQPSPPPATTIIIEEKAERPMASPEQCALYDEWMRLSLKQDATTGMHDLTTQEMERWSVLRQMFSVTSSPPVCPPNR